MSTAISNTLYKLGGAGRIDQRIITNVNWLLDCQRTDRQIASDESPGLTNFWVHFQKARSQSATDDIFQVTVGRCL